MQNALTILIFMEMKQKPVKGAIMSLMAYRILLDWSQYLLK